MRTYLSSPIWLWAARDLLRRPAGSILAAAALSVIVFVTGSALLFTLALSTTAKRVLSNAPALVVRKVSPIGWEPIEIHSAMRSAGAVTGVVSAKPRVWGVVAGPDGPLTVVGIKTSEPYHPWLVSPVPEMVSRGQAIVGPGVTDGASEPNRRLTLLGNMPLDITVVGRLTSGTGLIAQDLVLLPMEDARAVLGIEIGYASDLAIDVFHEQEALAMIPELAAAFPWPVRITTRQEAQSLYTADITRFGGLFMMTGLPSLLALGVLLVGTIREKYGHLYEIGLLKALGWTTADVVQLMTIRTCLVGVPALLGGLASACALVYWPGSLWPARLLLGWETNPPYLVLDTGGLLMTTVISIGFVFFPYLAASLLPTLMNVTADPQNMLEKEWF